MLNLDISKTLAGKQLIQIGVIKGKKEAIKEAIKEGIKEGKMITAKRISKKVLIEI